MRILIHGINFAPELSGIGKYSGEMAEWLSAQGHEVRMVTAPAYYPEWRVGPGFSSFKYRKERAKNNLVIYRCPLWVPAQPSGIKRLLHLASFALSSLPVMLRHIFWKPEVVMVIEPPFMCAPAALLVARLCRAKSLLHIQDFEVDAAFDIGILSQSWLRDWVLRLEARLMCCFDQISTISQNMALRVKQKGVMPEHILLFPNWVDTKLIFPMVGASRLRKELGIPSDAIVVLYSGNMGKKQGLEIVVEAARLLKPQHHIHFVLCGHGAAYESLRAMAVDIENIHWIPLLPIEHLNDLLNLGDIHLLPQHAKVADLVMPSKLTGILACGRPVVATTVKGTEVWSVVKGRGLNTQPGDIKAFAEAIILLAVSPSTRDTFGRAGRVYAETHLCKDSILGDFEAGLQQIVSQNKKCKI